jgi:uncharacterized protein involved in exopolysaccharide biosynthesis
MSQSPEEKQRDPYSEEIDLRYLGRVMLAGRWLIIGVTGAAFLLTTVFVFMLPNIYRAEALVAPIDKDSVGGLSALAGEYGGLASLVGINLGDQSVDKTALGLEILKSRKFVTEFIERHQALVPLLATEGIDRKTGELIIDRGVYDPDSDAWVREFDSSTGNGPSMQYAYQEFTEMLSVTQDKVTGFVTIAFEHRSPVVAMQWVNWLIKDLNETMMRQDVQEAEQAIAYLSEQIENTSLAGLKSVFYNLIEEQTKTVLLAKVSEEYLFKTVDPAVVPEWPTKPRRLLIIVLITFLGGVFGTIVHIMRWNTSRKA